MVIYILSTVNPPSIRMSGVAPYRVPNSPTGSVVEAGLGWSVKGNADESMTRPY